MVKNHDLGMFDDDDDDDDDSLFACLKCLLFSTYLGARGSSNPLERGAKRIRPEIIL